MKILKKDSLKTLLNNLADQANKLIEKTHQHIMQTTVLYEAKTYASRNLPLPEDESLDSYTVSIVGAYKSLKHDVSLILKAGIQRVLGSVNLATLNEKIDRVKGFINEQLNLGKNLQADKDRVLITGDYEAYKKQRIVLLLFGIGECIWSVMGFLRLGDIVVFSVILGVAIGLAQILVTKTAIQRVKEAEDTRKKRLYLLLTITSLCVFSLIIGCLRFYFVHTGAGASIPFLLMNPITFTAINLLFIAATALIVYHYYPTKSELSDIHKVERLDKEIAGCNKQSAALEATLNEYLKERELLVELRSMLVHDEQTLQKKVDACYEIAIGKFAHENSIKRTDGLYPRGFRAPVTPLPHVETELPLLTSN